MPMADDFSITTAQIVGLFMECICYGVYLVTLAQCLRSLLGSDVESSFKKKINWPMLTVTLLMALIATLDVAIGLRQNLDAFVYYTGPGGATVYFGDITYWVSVIKVADYVAQSIIGDGMLVYRCYLVYNRKWYLAAPSFVLWITGSTCGVLATVTIATLDNESSRDVSQVQPYVYSALASTLALSILTTSMIVYRIWSVDRQTARMVAYSSRASQLKAVMRIVVESAALYTTSVIVFGSTYIANNNANYGTSYNVVQIIGISFNLIIIRVNSGRAFEGTTKWSPTSAIPTRPKRPLSTF